MDGKELLCNDSTVRSVRLYTQLLTKFLNEFPFLREIYILDYFVDDHWKKLPISWQKCLSSVEPEELANFLDEEESIRNKNVWPLSLLSFRAAGLALALRRQPMDSLKSVEQFLRKVIGYKSNEVCSVFWKPPEEEFKNSSGQHKNLTAAFRRHVKPKKQHEIFRFAQLANFVLHSVGLEHVLDIGSGKGHLSRLLSFHYKYNVATVEADNHHISGARHFDKQAILTLNKGKETQNNHHGNFTFPDESEPYLPYPRHIEEFISLTSTKEHLQKIAREVWPANFNATQQELCFGLVGLHACGNLSATLLNLFAKTPEARILLSVGCCYMKLDTNGNLRGYPLSEYVSQLVHHPLSYQSREAACHAMEMYIKRLKENSETLKIHCYRAVLEELIIKHHPQLKHCGLQGVKHAEKMQFHEYALQALSKTTVNIPGEEYFSLDTLLHLQQWKKVIIIYSLRLLVAPIIESLILMDRVLFLHENSCPSMIIPIFDPSLSPRNHVLIAVKSDGCDYAK